MAIEDYQHSVLRDDVLDEFGKDITDATLMATASRKINDAQLWIAKARKDWPWRLKEYFEATSPGIAVTGDPTQGGFNVGNVNPNASGDLRKILVDGSSGTPGTSGYLVGIVTGPIYTLQSQYLGATAIGKNFTLMQGVFDLPIDFDRMSVLEAVTGLGERKYTYKSPLLFEKIKRAGNLVGNNDFVYTVKPDPLDLDRVQKYLLVYPYIDELGTLHGNYWRNIEKLDADADIPMVPVDDRITLLQMAYWFMSAKLKEPQERVAMYKATAMESLGIMVDNYGLGDEPDTLEEADLLSPQFIRPPSGYPDFHNIS